MHVSIPFIVFMIFFASMMLLGTLSLLLMKLSLPLLSSLLLFLLSLAASKDTLCFFSVVALITTIIIFYSFFYLGMSFSTVNFMWTLSLFAFSMLCLIVADSILTYLLGWDGLGASSFLLILYYNTLFSYRSGLATFLTNRLGDVFIIMSFVLMASKENIMDSMQIFPMKNSYLHLAFLLLLTGAATKSAQLPFSAWLPAAMAAPTPVSALVHSSTLVTAGIYLLYRYDSLMDCSFSSLCGYISLMGILLSLLAGFMAFYESDLKKLVAMSTLSQLGILIYILFQKQPEITLLHVMSHAFFKSLLFLVVGFLIIVGLGTQDARTKTFTKMLSGTAMLLLMTTSVSLMGFMFMPGFFSKDLILASDPEQGMSLIPYVLLMLSCILTVMYSTKSFIIMMNSMHLKQNTSNLVFNSMFIAPSLILFTMMMFFGYFFYFNTLETEPYISTLFNKLLGVLIILSGLSMTFAAYKSFKNKDITMMVKNIVEKFSQMVNMNWLSNNMMSSSLVPFSKLLVLENSWMEMVVEIKTKTMMSSKETSFSKKTGKYTNIESVMFIMMILMFLVSLSVML